MEILQVQSALLTNYEAMVHIQESRDKRHKQQQQPGTTPTTTSRKSLTDLNTIEFEVSHYQFHLFNTYFM